MARHGVREAGHLVVMGASAGGVEALSTVVAGLPEDLPAPVLVVLHVPAWGTSVLPDILGRCGPLPAHHAVDGEPLVSGHIYVAPPDHHLMTDDGRARLSRAPKENGVRPAIDTLFRSAAETHGPSVVAAVLSGTLDDGTAGLLAVKANGGVTVVQDPADAAFPSMPESAIRFADPTVVAPIGAIAGVVAEHVRESLPGDHAPGAGGEVEMDPTDSAHAAAKDQPGSPSELNCPECGGTLWEQASGDLLRFRCRVGHAYSPESLFSEQLESLEGALWAAVVALQERGDLAVRLARRVGARGQHERARRYERQAEAARRQAERIREAILHLSRSGEHEATDGG